MYLKKLEIHGFKSFADKIGLDFDNGITAVVGPNGSGKSNIADAVRWVLGEQSAKQLRGAKMEDVIFAGTEHRKAQGFAEVSLHIENSEGRLPVDFSDVVITRRVYRSGESEYAINKAACRLKDIHELFMDTGLGKDGYSIIGQGRVDEILSSRSEDRRHIFEEASGIMKYKVRKIETERKLEQTSQNMLRIDDILSELQAQIGPLSEQAEKARQYLEFAGRLKEVEVSLFLDNIECFRERLEEVEKGSVTVRSHIAQENMKLDKILRENAESSGKIRDLDERVEELRGLVHHAETLVEKMQSEIAVNLERSNALREAIQRLRQEAGDAAGRRQELEKEYETRHKRAGYLKHQQGNFEKKIAEQETALQLLMASLDSSEQRTETMKQQVVDAQDKLAEHRSETQSVRHHSETLEKRKTAIGTEVRMHRLEIDREGMRKEEYSQTLREISIRGKSAAETLARFDTEKQLTEKTVGDLRQEKEKLNHQISAADARLRTLQDMEKNMEGYGRSVRQVMAETRRDPQFGTGIHGAVAQLVKMDSRYTVALDIALAGAQQNIITESEDDAKRAIAYLKRTQAGRATFLPVSTIAPRVLDDRQLQTVSRMPGFVGIASELVTCDSKFRNIIKNLLGRIVIAEHIDDGIQMARQFGYAFRIVTLEGDVINPGGSLAGGSQDQRMGGILSRGGEIENIGAKLASDRSEIAAISSRMDEALALLQEVEAERLTALEGMRQLEVERVRAEGQIRGCEDMITRINGRISMLDDELRDIARKSEEYQQILLVRDVAQKALESEIDDNKKQISAWQNEHKEAQNSKDDLYLNLTDLKVSLGSVLESIAATDETLARIQTDIDSVQKGEERRQSDITRSGKEIQNLDDKNLQIQQEIRQLSETRAGREMEMDRLIEEKRVLEEDASGLAGKINEVNRTLSLLQEEISRLDIRRTKTEAEMEAVQNRLWDEYQLTYSNALPLRQEVQNPQQAQREINELRSKIRVLGPVNVNAVEEYLKTKERLEFMSVQKADLEDSMEKLRKVIAEMTSLMKKQFLEQFRLINDNFNAVFRELFEGGRAELRLVDESNILESGIDIDVQPPGKKLQSMMLLSGGERALTAIALLFAILRLRPTPFCILDEIEAALDDANVYRFARYIRNYSEKTQFIMVTHRKGTMEASDTLYGVTMQEHGVSRVVSMRLSESAGQAG